MVAACPMLRMTTTMVVEDEEEDGLGTADTAKVAAPRIGLVRSRVVSDETLNRMTARCYRPIPL